MDGDPIFSYMRYEAFSKNKLEVMKLEHAQLGMP